MRNSKWRNLVSVLFLASHDDRSSFSRRVLETIRALKERYVHIKAHTAIVNSYHLNRYSLHFSRQTSSVLDSATIFPTCATLRWKHPSISAIRIHYWRNRDLFRLGYDTLAVLVSPSESRWARWVFFSLEYQLYSFWANLNSKTWLVLGENVNCWKYIYYN